MKKSFRNISIKLMALTLVGAAASPSTAHADPLSDILGSFFGSLTSTLTGIIGGVVTGVTSAMDAAIAGLFATLFGTGSCSTSDTIGGVLCRTVASMDSLPGFISAMGYLIGIIMVISGLLHLQEHVLDPRRMPLSDPMKRFIAAGMLFTIPTVAGAAQSMVSGGITNDLETNGYAGHVSGGGGLDTMMVALFQDIFSPMMSVLFGLGYFAGLILVVVGIMRVIKTAEQGARGPVGFGTIMTFVVAGVLFSSGTIMQAFSVSLFGDSTIATYAVLNTTSGDAAVDDHLLAIVSTVLVFMTIVGWISFLRGFFILRDVAEGNGQASLMVSLTHMFGGALAVNLGPLMNAVQSTFGLTSFGVSFN